MWEWLNKNSGGLQFIAILIAVIIFILERIFSARSNYRTKMNLLDSMLKELEWNSQLLIDIGEDENEDRAVYYDTTRANFKCKNDVLLYAITTGHGILNSRRGLMEVLIGVNSAIGCYNQQVQEQHDCRFSRPDLTGYATKLIRDDQNTPKKWMCDYLNRPEELKNFIEEIRLRNWAINQGKKVRLRPALLKALGILEKDINHIKESKRWWHFWKG